MFAIRPVTLRTKYVFQRVNCCDWYIVVPLRYYSAASERDRGCAPLIQSGHSSALNRTSFVQTRGPKNDFDFPPFHEAIAFTIAGHTWIQVAMNVEAAVSLALPTVGSKHCVIFGAWQTWFELFRNFGASFEFWYEYVWTMIVSDYFYRLRFYYTEVMYC